MTDVMKGLLGYLVSVVLSLFECVLLETWVIVLHYEVDVTSVPLCSNAKYLEVWNTETFFMFLGTFRL